MIEVGSCKEQNKIWRVYMEDYERVVKDFTKTGACLACVFDGHGGGEVSRMCRDRYPEVLSKILDEEMEIDLEEALAKALSKIEEEVEQLDAKSGTTASVIYVEPVGEEEYLVVSGGVGDSKMVYLDLATEQIHKISVNHNVENPRELARISETGGAILNKRVFGAISVTRSIGDSFFKSQLIPAPLTTRFKVSTQSVLIIATDGLWDVCTEEDAYKIIKSAGTAQGAAQDLVKYALENHSKDNVTVVVIYL